MREQITGVYAGTPAHEGVADAALEKADTMYKMCMGMCDDTVAGWSADGTWDGASVTMVTNMLAMASTDTLTTVAQALMQIAFGKGDAVVGRAALTEVIYQDCLDAAWSEV